MYSSGSRSAIRNLPRFHTYGIISFIAMHLKCTAPQYLQSPIHIVPEQISFGKISPITAITIVIKSKGIEEIKTEEENKADI